MRQDKMRQDKMRQDKMRQDKMISCDKQGDKLW